MSQPTTAKFKRLKPDALLPKRMTEDAAGMDLFAYLPNQAITLSPSERCLIPCGFAMAMEPGYEAQVRPRSGLALKQGITVLNSPGTIDHGYRGQVGVILVNLGEDIVVIQHQERIAQLVIAAVPAIEVFEVDDLDDTARGTGGFGSTGV